ncbi:hypothetical protein JOC34_001569 [Virgibacillus halotolerans]|nr:hypothetical protein [Virgibacillus halotolerans]
MQALTESEMSYDVGDLYVQANVEKVASQTLNVGGVNILGNYASGCAIFTAY